MKDLRRFLFAFPPLAWLISFLLPLSFSYSLAVRTFHLLDRSLSEQGLILLVPALGFAVLFLGLFPHLQRLAVRSARITLLAAQASLGGLVFVLLDPLPLPAKVTDFVSVAALVFALALPAAPAYDFAARRGDSYPLLFSAVVGTPLAFFVTGFLSHSYPGYWIAPLSFISLVLANMGIYFLLRYLRTRAGGDLTGTLFGLLIVSLALLFTLALALLVLRYTDVFDRERFMLNRQSWGGFLALAMLSPVWAARGLHLLSQGGWLERWRKSALWTFGRENLPGLLLGSVFFAAYTLLSYVFNHPGRDLTENFLAADNFAWIGRLAWPDGTGIEMRAVHPFAFFIFRPLIWLFSLLFNGDRITAALLLVPLAGGACVLLAWMFVRKWTGSRVYALLMASLLGVSTSHILFASLVESYIFSAAVLLLFFVLLLEEKTHWLALVAVGVLTFGITITNFIQTFIAFVVARPRFKAIFLYGLLASAFAITLTDLHASVFPSALAFYDPAGAGVESEYSIAILGQPAWRVTGRVILLLRNILLYSIAAPHPFILTTEVGGTFPRFNFFRLTPGNYSFSSYDGWGKVLILAWLVLLAGAGLAFLWKSARARRFDLSAAFPLVILFNFILHLGYGYEPFLYSADWTYALVLFAAVSLSGFGKRRWFQAGLCIFIGLLMWNQWRFVQTILEAISPFFR